MGGLRRRVDLKMAAIHNTLTGIASAVVPITVSASPSLLTELTLSSSHTSGGCTATPSGGSGSYSYAWIKVTNNYPDLVINTPLASGITVSATGMVKGDTWTDTIRCTVTDAANPSNSGYTNVLVTIVRL